MHYRTFLSYLFLAFFVSQSIAQNQCLKKQSQILLSATNQPVPDAAYNRQFQKPSTFFFCLAQPQGLLMPASQDVWMIIKPTETLSIVLQALS